MSDNRALYIEETIIKAVKERLTGRVNEILRETDFSIPIIEFGSCGCGDVVVPVISLNSCEKSEKERIIRLDAYSLTITFSLPETTESELFCYAYSGAIGRAFYDDPTLGGIVDRAIIIEKKYVLPKKPHCGEGWELVIYVRVTVEAVNV